MTFSEAHVIVVLSAADGSIIAVESVLWVFQVQTKARRETVSGDAFMRENEN